MRSINIMKAIGDGNNLSKVDNNLKKTVVEEFDEESRLKISMRLFATNTSSKSINYSNY